MDPGLQIAGMTTSEQILSILYIHVCFPLLTLNLRQSAQSVDYYHPASVLWFLCLLWPILRYRSKGIPIVSG